MGVSAGDRVALILPNCPQFFVAEFGAWKAGAIVGPAQSDLQRARARDGAQGRTAPTIVVALTPFYDRVKSVQARTAVRSVIATSIKEYLPPVLRVAVHALQGEEGRPSHRARPGDRWFQDLLDAASGTPPRPRCRCGLTIAR